MGKTRKYVIVVAAVLVMVASLLLVAGSALAAPVSDVGRNLNGPQPAFHPSPVRAHLVGLPSATGITDPSAISPAAVFDFSANAEYSSPTSFGAGTFSLPGGSYVSVIGSSWASWNPQTNGKHVMYCNGDVCTITFAMPRAAVGAVVEPNVTSTFEITIKAYDAGSNEIGSFTRSISGAGGAAFLGLSSTAWNIKSITISAPSDAYGFAFSDLTFSSLWGGFLSPLAPTDTRIFSNIYAKATPLPVRFAAIHGTNPITNLAASLKLTGPNGKVYYLGKFRYYALGDYYTCTIPRGSMASLPTGVSTITVAAGGETHSVQILVGP